MTDGDKPYERPATEKEALARVLVGLLRASHELRGDMNSLVIAISRLGAQVDEVQAIIDAYVASREKASVVDDAIKSIEAWLDFAQK